MPPWKYRRPANDFNVTPEALADAGNGSVEHDLRPTVVVAAAVCVCTEGRPAVVVACSGADSENVGALERNAWLLLLLPTPPSTDADNEGRGRRRRQYPDAAERQSRDCIGRASYYVVTKSIKEGSMGVARWLLVRWMVVGLLLAWDWAAPSKIITTNFRQIHSATLYA